MKKVLVFILVLAVITAAGLYWLRSNIDGMVQAAIVKYGTAMTSATVKLDKVEIKPTDGKGTLRGLQLGNPEGFKTQHLLKADMIEIEVDVSTLTKDVIVINRIAVIAPDIIYEKGEAMTNIAAVQKSIAQYLGPGQSSKSGKKLIVKEFTVKGARAQASAAFMDGKTVALNLPDLQLRNLGQAKDGVTPGELGQEIAAAIEGKLSAAVSFDNLLKSTGKAVDKAGKAIKGLFQ
jgi:uncharacterized protein involved in outer membrane biogenesis